jgi:pSer/pThr/pTyr-binding forkhead associated (FHA) protein
MPDVAQKFRIGRDAACDLVITDRSVSRRHADLVIEPGGGLEILDKESSAGTFLVRDGTAHSISRARLRPTDSIRFGECEMTVQDLLTRLRQIPPRAPSSRSSDAPPSRPPPPATPTTAQPGRMVRCSCGSIKKRGTPCPACGL